MNGIAEFVHEATQGTWLGVFAIVAVFAAGASVVWMWRRLRSLPVDRLANPDHDPDLDGRHLFMVGHQPLTEEAIERGTRRLWADLHDVEEGDE